MYNLLMRAKKGRWNTQPGGFEPDRFLEYTQEAIIAKYRSLSDAVVSELKAMPALFCYERRVNDVARFGSITTIQRGTQELTLTWEFDPAIPPIEPHVLQSLYGALDIGTKDEIYREHWAVKDVNLRAVLTKAGLLVTPEVNVAVENAHPRGPATLPRAFISYSHDSEPHKRWVRELAERLTHDGVHVMLDQWDLSLGDELTHFMERSLSESDYVILICTEAYVNKADERVGGVGYEARMFSSLLGSRAPVLRDGRSRLIPVLRQSSLPRSVPRFAGGRLYVDLSHDAQASGYEQLLRALHRTPKYSRPPVGRSPFAPGEGRVLDETAVPLTSTKPGQDLIPSLQATRATSAAALVALQWRLPKSTHTLDIGANTDEELMPVIATHSDYLHILVQAAQAGVLSPSRSATEIQRVMEPEGWASDGSRRMAVFPFVLGWAAFHLIGAMWLSKGEAWRAVQCAREQVETRPGERRVVLDVGDLHRWPWDCLRRFPKTLPWVNETFADAEEFWVAIVAHALALNFAEFLERARRGPTFDLIHNSDVYLPQTSLDFWQEDPDIHDRALQMLLRDTSGLRVTLNMLSPATDVRQLWAMWIEYQRAWLYNCDKPDSGPEPQGNLIERLLS